MWVIKNRHTGRYVAEPVNLIAYTTDLDLATKYDTEAEAKANCFRFERVAEVETATS